MASAPVLHVDTPASRLYQARIASGLSLRELAKRAGTSHATLHAYENHKKTPSITTYLKILEAAGFAADIVIHKRIREQDGIDRGEELLAVLKLAALFPVKASRQMHFPKFHPPH